jgi:hypothetical protein
MDKETSRVLKEIGGYFKKNEICDSLIHFGSSVYSKTYHDVDLFCVLNNAKPKDHIKIIKAIIHFQKLYPEFLFTYREEKVLKSTHGNKIISFSVSQNLKRYPVLWYGISKDSRLLAGKNPGKARKPTVKECIGYINFVYNANIETLPGLCLKSFLRSALLARGIYVRKNRLIKTFEDVYKIKLNRNLKILFSGDKNKANRSVRMELKNLYVFILKSNNSKPSNKIDFGSNSLSKAFVGKMYLKVASMFRKCVNVEKIYAFINSQQRIFDKKFK